MNLTATTLDQKMPFYQIGAEQSLLPRWSECTGFKAMLPVMAPTIP